MNFLSALKNLTTSFDEAGVHYALIGGFAMAIRGVQRATVDLDFILLLEDLEKAHLILENLGYRRGFKSENVSHYVSNDSDLGRIDILHAFRGPTLSMLDRADRLQISGSLRVPVVQIEDIIGLKIQSSVNDPKRIVSDWADIRLLVEHCGNSGIRLDWDLIADYLDIFHLRVRFSEMKEWYDATDEE